ncbi:amino acid permease-domain-containing protein [Yarrowia lipolytica]|uniref:YALI0C09889p n=1 Tax=Yarrowia lipolytica (strain CLIB 122 / E 150) TaxID=284591 RepID=Q6CCF3_YARLI|nr:YALI0C09889p [Yarrowia lipolytica CLIB122]RDW43402.1 amino acid permease-domain-containing protein [Yarrowia lipolytica]RDW50180.1 amino acid permease-domain-containing protein [Yarrowia lipolytica]CAG81966.1 YALI0C09889p [Yarrowia lipolytica CLIB122]|eukprot:XP_501659.1 YALI0C09889p [Yarrowia lipolytica CLIB122]
MSTGRAYMTSRIANSPTRPKSPTQTSSVMSETKPVQAESISITSEAGQVTGQVEVMPSNAWQRFKYGFGPADTTDMDFTGLTPMEITALKTANSPLQRNLKGRHLQMIAIGGSIGTGLFIGSGSTLSQGGPAALLIAYGIIGVMLLLTMHALGELAVCFPVSGGFFTLFTRFIDPGWGFAMAWNYVMSWFVILPLELVAAAMTVNFWNEINGTSINTAAWIIIFWTLIVCINLFGVRGYGEAEFVFSIIKIAAICGFIIFGIIMAAGGGPSDGAFSSYQGGKLWKSPGTLANGFKGVCSVFVTAAFAFAGTELAGLAAAETENPRKMLPKATKQVFWRICLFYIVALTVVGLLVPYDNEMLLNGSSSADATASPFVIAIRLAGVKGLPSVMNVVIMIAVLSVGNAGVYAFSRTIAGMAEAGQAPKMFAYIDRQGRPIVGIAVVLIFSLFAFISAAGAEVRSAVFNWLLALSGLSSVVVWGSINLAHIRFRQALKYRGRDTGELTFSAGFGVYGSYVGLSLNILVLIAQFWIALFPLGGKPNAEDFFMAYLAAPVILAFVIGYKLVKRDGILKISEIDIDTGRREKDLEKLKAEIAQEEYDLSQRGFAYRVYNFWC